MPLEDQTPQFARTDASSQPEPAPKRELVRRTCPRITPPNPPRWVSKKEAVGGRCNYIGPDGNLCPYWRAKDSRACPCHVEAYEGPDSKAGMRTRRTRSRKSRVAVMMEPNTMWVEKEPL